jgi:crossover junction endodeoxyribonuclease RuvC
VSFGSISTAADAVFPDRLAEIYRELGALIEEYAPEAMAIEELFFNKNVTTGIKVAQARGVVLLLATQHALPVYEYPPSQIKQGLVGYGKAEKAQVQSMVKTILHLAEVPRPDDTADALAVAICHGHAAPGLLRFKGVL